MHGTQLAWHPFAITDAILFPLDNAVDPHKHMLHACAKPASTGPLLMPQSHLVEWLINGQ